MWKLRDSDQTDTDFTADYYEQVNIKLQTNKNKTCNWAFGTVVTFFHVPGHDDAGCNPFCFPRTLEAKCIQVVCYCSFAA